MQWHSVGCEGTSIGLQVGDYQVLPHLNPPFPHDFWGHVDIVLICSAPHFGCKRQEIVKKQDMTVFSWGLWVFLKICGS